MVVNVQVFLLLFKFAKPHMFVVFLKSERVVGFFHCGHVHSSKGGPERRIECFLKKTSKYNKKPPPDQILPDPTQLYRMQTHHSSVFAPGPWGILTISKEDPKRYRIGVGSAAGLRCWGKAPVSAGVWARIQLLPICLNPASSFLTQSLQDSLDITINPVNALTGSRGIRRTRQPRQQKGSVHTAHSTGV